MDRVLIARAEEGGTPGTWYRVLGESAPALVCGGCGKSGGRLSDHEIADDGTVNPSILCPHDGCGWHVWGRLEGWTPVST